VARWLVGQSDDEIAEAYGLTAANIATRRRIEGLASSVMTRNRRKLKPKIERDLINQLELIARLHPLPDHQAKALGLLSMREHERQAGAERQRRWQQADPERDAARITRWREGNREKYNAYLREYRASRGKPSPARTPPGSAPPQT